MDWLAAEIADGRKRVLASDPRWIRIDNAATLDIDESHIASETGATPN